MEITAQEPFAVPAIFFMVCYTAAGVFLLSVYWWLWRAYKLGAQGAPLPLWSNIGQFQYWNFLGVMIFSLLYCAYKTATGQDMPALYVEVIALAGAIVFALWRGGLSEVIGLIRVVIVMFMAVVLFWVASLVMGWVVSVVLQALYSSFLTREDCNIYAVMVVGMAWNVPIFMMYRRLDRGYRWGLKFHHFLMPVILAYALLILPLYIQNSADSGAFDKWKRVERPLRGV